MGKGFGILRGIIGILILALVLAFVPFTIYKGDIVTSIFLSVGMFMVTLVTASILMVIFKRG